MPDRVSLIEQYDNRDVIAQIYRIIDIAEHGAIETLTATKEGSTVKLVFTMHDGTKHEITFESNGVKDVYAVQSGSTETVHVVLDDDTEKTFAFNIAIAGVTTDTQQTITAPKIFTAPQTFSGGIVGTTMIDGDVQVSNGHSLSVAGDIDTAGDMQVAGNAEFLGNVEAGGMAIEESNGRTVLSNPNGVRMEGQLSLDAMTVAGMTIAKSEDRATILDNDDPIIVPHTLEVTTNLTGTRDSQVVNGNRLQNDLDAYVPMVRTSGNVIKAGILANSTDGSGYTIYVGGNTVRFVKLFHTTEADVPITMLFSPDKLNTRAHSGILSVISRQTSITAVLRPLFQTTVLGDDNRIVITYDGTETAIWYHYDTAGTNRRITVMTLMQFFNRVWEVDGVTEVETLDPAIYTTMVVPEVIQ